MTPDFLRPEEVLRIHQDQIERYGGDPNIRDAGLLLSAIETPRATFGGRFLHGDLFEMAAAYLFHIVQNHPFVDGNKRAGTAAALVFLSLNDVRIDASDESLADLVLDVARGKVKKAGIAEFFRRHVV